MLKTNTTIFFSQEPIKIKLSEMSIAKIVISIPLCPFSLFRTASLKSIRGLFLEGLWTIRASLTWFSFSCLESGRRASSTFRVSGTSSCLRLLGHAIDCEKGHTNKYYFPVQAVTEIRHITITVIPLGIYRFKFLSIASVDFALAGFLVDFVIQAP